MKTDSNYWTHKTGCPRLFLAPMEGLADGIFRRSYRLIGGFDEACTEFIRVSRNPHIPSLAKTYNPNETAPIPQAAQIMGYEPELMAQMAAALEARGAPRIDLNCGCPSNRVTGRGAGSSLLKEPPHIEKVVRAMVDVCTIPVSVKLRSGFDDTSLFEDNLAAVQAGGASFISLHPRTRAEGYGPPANWDLITQAKDFLDIPVVGNGDILTADDAVKMVEKTGCDGLMVGRGAVRDPWIFHTIKAHYANQAVVSPWDTTLLYLNQFLKEMESTQVRTRTQLNKLKQLIRYLFDVEPLKLAGHDLIRSSPEVPRDFLNLIIDAYQTKNH